MTVSSFVDNPIYTRPTGFSFVPPVGPAMPVVASPISTFDLFLIPPPPRGSAEGKGRKMKNIPETVFFELVAHFSVDSWGGEPKGRRSITVELPAEMVMSSNHMISESAIRELIWQAASDYTDKAAEMAAEDESE